MDDLIFGFEERPIQQPVSGNQVTPLRRLSKSEKDGEIPGDGCQPPSESILPNPTLVVKNLAFSMKHDKFLEILAAMELKPQSLNFHYDSAGTFRGMCFAKFKTLEEAAKAHEVLDGTDIEGRKLRIEYKKKGSAGLGGGGVTSGGVITPFGSPPQLPPAVVIPSPAPSLGKPPLPHQTQPHQQQQQFPLSSSPGANIGSAILEEEEKHENGGGDSLDEETRKIYEQLRRWNDNEKLQDLAFPPTLSSEERSRIEVVAQRLHLVHDVESHADSRVIAFTKRKGSADGVANNNATTSFISPTHTRFSPSTPVPIKGRSRRNSTSQQREDINGIGGGSEPIGIPNSGGNRGKDSKNSRRHSHSNNNNTLQQQQQHQQPHQQSDSRRLSTSWNGSKEVPLNLKGGSGTTPSLSTSPTMATMGPSPSSSLRNYSVLASRRMSESGAPAPSNGIYLSTSLPSAMQQLSFGQSQQRIPPRLPDGTRGFSAGRGAGLVSSIKPQVLPI
mmetsp:Transcript_35318/g.57136  ORF Transcript_35318/g.57136 Transcript_35318/m.57136 type:complete len:501 (-) Transcript_35318:44-1546(-)